MLWHIKDNKFHREDIIQNGHKYLIGHLKLGVRGTLDEFRASEMVAVNLPLIYDQVGNGWREPVNAFNPLYTTVKIDGQSVDTLNMEPIFHVQSLNLKDASMMRESTFEIGGKKVTIYSKRFVDKNMSRSIFSTFELTVDEDAQVNIFTGIDSIIWDIHGPHIENIQNEVLDNTLKVSGTTHENKHLIDVYKAIDIGFKNYKKEVITKDGILGYDIRIDAKKGQVYRMYQYHYIAVDETKEDGLTAINVMKTTGFEQRLLAHQKLWDKHWEIADVQIKGNDEADLALRYSIYHLLLLEPGHNTDLSIPARGISGQTYKGAIFWDTEVFMLPFFLNTNPESAKSLINYRIKGLKGALNKANSYGYQGAFYAWESQNDGLDACTDYNVTDVFTNRPVRTYFKDKQIHISADVVYGLKSYIEHTNDYDILKQGGLEMAIEVARFYVDYGRIHPTEDTLEFLDVMGPDEYHERVHNNLFTNLMVQMVFEFIIKLEKHYENAQDEYFKRTVEHLNFKKVLDIIRKYVNRIKINKPNNQGVIEQFDGYFRMKDIDLNTLLSQRLHPNEYLGGAGLAGDTQIIKQADVVTALYMFKKMYDKTVYQENFNYYEPRTEHGSSLSMSMYAIVASWIGNTDYAYQLFMRSATIDLTGKSKQYAGKVYIGGTHPAAAGGAYLAVLYGFSGLDLTDEGVKISPNLPKEIKGLSFRVKHRGVSYEIEIDGKAYDIRRLK